MSILPIFLSVLAFYTPRDQGLRPSQPLNYSAFYVCDLAAERPTFGLASAGDMSYAKDTGLVYVWSGAAWVSVAGGGGGAPTTAPYITQIPDAGLSAEQALSLLVPSGLLFNTTGTGVLSIYAGSACGGTDKAVSISAAGVVTCSAVAYANVTGTPAVVPVPTGTGFSHVTAGVLDGASKLVNLTAATDTAPNQGAVTTVLHGNAAGQGAYGSVVDADITAMATTKLTGTITDAQLANNYSGIGTCTNQFARVLNDNAAPTCASVVLASDVSGTLGTSNGGTGGSVSTLLDTLSSTRGAILERGLAGWQVITPGLSGTVLTSAGASADPIWAAPATPSTLTTARVATIAATPGLPKPLCNAVRRANWQRTNCQ